jgi:hypothetical protein
MRITHVRSLLPALLLLLALPMSSHAQIGVGVSINIEPPALPVYEQPPLPEVGYMWTPGFWAYGPDGYYWVPGTWVQPPTVGVLWTPGYWGFEDGVYLFHDGYWGPHIGFYGGVNYGFGYGGIGFEGGEWRGGGFYYNRSVVNIGSDVHVTNVYNKTVIVNNTTRVSFNGGNGGTSARPTPAETAAANEHHIARTPAQEQHIHAASTNHALLASVNHGAPAVAATQKPGDFSKGIVKASRAGGPVQAHATPAPAAHAPAASHEGVAHPAAARPEEKPAAERPEAREPAAKPEAPKSAAKPEAPKPAAKPEAPKPAARPAAPHPPAAAEHPQPQHAAPPKAPQKPAPEEKREKE